MVRHSAPQNRPAYPTSGSSDRGTPARLRLEPLEARVSPTSWLFAMGLPVFASPDADLADEPSLHSTDGEPLPELDGFTDEVSPATTESLKAEETAQVSHPRLRQASDSLGAQLPVDNPVARPVLPPDYRPPNTAASRDLGEHRSVGREHGIRSKWRKQPQRSDYEHSRVVLKERDWGSATEARQVAANRASLSSYEQEHRRALWDSYVAFQAVPAQQASGGDPRPPVHFGLNSSQPSLFAGLADSTSPFAVSAYPIGGYPFGPASGTTILAEDLTGDGRLDLAVPCLSPTKSAVSVLPGQDGGRFGGAVLTDRTGYGGTLDAVAGHFNGDSRLDLAVTNWSQNKVYVMSVRESGFAPRGGPAATWGTHALARRPPGN